MNRILAVREGDDVAALRREVSEAFYAHGDTIGGNQVNMYLSDLTEPGLTDAHRRDIAEGLARYARADPEETGQLRRMLTLGGAAIGKGPRGPSNRDPASGSDGPRALTRSDQRAIRNLERRAREHEEKLEQYRADPYSQDNDGRLRNAPNDAIRDQIVRRRAEILERDIRNFRDEIRKKTGEVK